MAEGTIENEPKLMSMGRYRLMESVCVAALFLGWLLAVVISFVLINNY
ncbi:unnamed protein product [Nezara viridula]|uniref:Uncharacterized protein n=1 Tax=Nezara viridula TaxID=85310 RepID=A0A9P0HR99_NEZVI|nr:unnamed protein product [Nezara viridula]